MIAGTAADQTVAVWRASTLERIATFPREVRNVAFSSDGRSVLGEAPDGSVFEWNLEGSSDAGSTRRHAPSFGFGNWLSDPLSAPERATKVAERQAAQLPCSLCEIPSFRDGILSGRPTTAATLAVSPDGSVMFLGLPSGHVEVWDVARRARRFAFAAHKVPVTALVLSPDGRTLATGSLDNSTALWSAADGRNLARFYEHNRPVWALAFSPDGKTLAAGSCDKAIKLYSVELRRCVGSLALYRGVPEGYEQEIRLLRFSPDGTILAAALGDGSLRLFRAEPFAVTDATP